VKQNNILKIFAAMKKIIKFILPSLFLVIYNKRVLYCVRFLGCIKKMPTVKQLSAAKTKGTCLVCCIVSKNESFENGDNIFKREVSRCVPKCLVW